jgi:hypothetical protein
MHGVYSRSEQQLYSWLLADRTNKTPVTLNHVFKLWNRTHSTFAAFIFTNESSVVSSETCLTYQNPRHVSHTRTRHRHLSSSSIRTLQFWTFFDSETPRYSALLSPLPRKYVKRNPLKQRFSNFFQVGITFIRQNVLRTTLLLSALKANCLRFSTIVCDTQFTLILFFLSFLD